MITMAIEAWLVGGKEFGFAMMPGANFPREETRAMARAALLASQTREH
jgi:hypothetical protein